ncbi:LacI family DNA-binding transcriptional regulator [Deinococcus sp.]|uniref:LacI family DNA-binding transcriptional regulator n=1 Tax=Deinococcus sp. TaxID=47478 RepID=UPI003CC64CFC
MTRVTLRDVAVHAGVSHQTVSNVLNDHPSIRPHTRERVLASIRALDYHPNVAAKALRESRVTILCCAFYGRSTDDIADPYYNLIQSAFIAEATASGYSITTAFLNEERPESFTALRGAFLQGRFAGTVLVGTNFTAERLTDLHRWDIPAILFDYAVPDPHFAMVTADYKGGMELLVAHLAERGLRHLTLVIPTQDKGTTARMRLDGFLEAVRARGLRYEIEDGDWMADSGEEAFRRIWARPERPEAVICGNDRMAAGALLAARTLGLSVPNDVSITGFDDFEFARYTAPSLTTVHVPHGEMARSAVRMLIARIGTSAAQEEASKEDHCFLKTPVTLVVRESA